MDRPWNHKSFDEGDFYRSLNAVFRFMDDKKITQYSMVARAASRGQYHSLIDLFYLDNEA